MPLKDLILIRMLCDTGVRVSEFCDLDLSQIDEDKRSAVIQTKRPGKSGLLFFKEKKQPNHKYSDGIDTRAPKSQITTESEI